MSSPALVFNIDYEQLLNVLVKSVLASSDSFARSPVLSFCSPFTVHSTSAAHASLTPDSKVADGTPKAELRGNSS